MPVEVEVVRVIVAATPQIVRVNVETEPRVIRVNIPGLQGPAGEDGEDGEAGNAARETRYATGTITVHATDDDDILVGAGSATINLPASAARDAGRPYLIIDADHDADTNAKVITPNGAETVRGLPTYSVQFRGGVVELWPRSADDAEGAGWYARES